MDTASKHFGDQSLSKSPHDELQALMVDNDRRFLTRTAGVMSACRCFGSMEKCPQFDHPTHPCESEYWAQLGDLIYFAEHAFAAEERLLRPLRDSAFHLTWEAHVAAHAEFLAELGDFTNEGSGVTVCRHIDQLVTLIEAFFLAHRLEHFQRALDALKALEKSPEQSTNRG